MNRDQLVEKMLDTRASELMDTHTKQDLIFMSRALDVVLAEVLREPTEHDLNACVVPESSGFHDGCVRKAISNRLAEYSAPREKTLQEKMLELLQSNRCTTEQLSHEITALLEEGGRK